MDANLAKMHRATAERLGPNTAIRFKRWGRFEDITWAEYREAADRAAAGLIELGIKPGDRVSILSENRPEWVIADQAIQSASAVNVPLHAPLSPAQVAYQVSHSGARGIFVSNQEQADKVAAVIGELPDLEFLISFDPVTAPAKLKSLTLAALQQRGFQAGEKGRAEIARRESTLSHKDLATIIYTSGTTGNPKGVMLSHGNLVSNAIGTLAISKVDADDVLLSWLPYSHIYARTVDVYLSAKSGMTIAMAESIDTLMVNLAEIQPTWLTAVPRFYEKVWTAVEQMEPEQRAKTLHKIFGPRLKQLSSGGAPLPKHICKGFFEAGIKLFEGYGLTESSPVVCFNHVDSWRIGTVGQPIADTEFKIADDGEILIRGPQIMQGYWKNPEATAETVKDGWLYTGDVGFLDADGFLTITDRKKDLIITSGGKNIAPSEVERVLISDPYIDQAVVYGDGRNFVSALIVPNFPLLEEKCKELGCKAEVKGEFIATRALADFFRARINDVMQVLSQPERVKEFLILGRPFAASEDELTATHKVRRRHIIQKFESQLAALYSKEKDRACAE